MKTEMKVVLSYAENRNLKSFMILFTIEVLGEMIVYILCLLL